MRLRVGIDFDRCTGAGACEQVCPEVFYLRESDGLAEVTDEEPHPTLWDSVRRAQEACPEDAVIIEEFED